MRVPRLYCRISPEEDMGWEYISVSKDGQSIHVRRLQDLDRRKSCKNTGPALFKSYETDGIFYHQSQDEVYEKVTFGVLDSLFKGNHDAIILSYGQSSSGKSVTLSGLLNAYENRGITPRIVLDLFKHIETMSGNIKVVLLMSYIEITKKGAVDLLKPLPSGHLDINSLSKVTARKVSNLDYTLENIFRAEGRKEFAEGVDYLSHAGTSILTFQIIKRNIGVTNDVKTVSKLHLIDLAGIDNYGKSTCRHKKRLDVGQANLFKSQLDYFVTVLSTDIPEQVRVKQRLNIFIKYLGNSLNRRSVIRLVAHIKTDLDSLLITHSVLRFGQLVLSLKTFNKPVATLVTESRSLQVDQLMKEMENYNKEKIYRCIFMNEDLSKNLNPDRIYHLKHLVYEYLQNKVGELTVYNVSDANITLTYLKEYYNDLKEKQVISLREQFENGFMEGLLSRTSQIKTENSKTSSRTSKGSLKKQNESIIRNKSTPGNSGMKLKETATVPSLTSMDASAGKKRSGRGKIRPQPSSVSADAGSRGSGSQIPSNGKKETKSDVLLDLVSVPESIPEYEEAYADFSAVKLQECQPLIDDYHLSDVKAKETYLKFLKEVKKLQDARELAEIRGHEFLQAQMIKKYEDMEVDSISKSDTDKVCDMKRKEAQNLVIQKQESVLKLQCEFRMYLDRKSEIKREIQEMFNEYCSSKYKLLVPNLDVKTIIGDTVELSESVIMQDFFQDLTLHSENEKCRKDFAAYKKFLYRELKKKELYKKKSITWTSNLKKPPCYQ